ncbi:hypothetical protein HY57_13720 [Dyella japonica A8]|uniref:Uncharacterized protein n=1 Tax=Dyella japonica A8 TaxID=1217721 RepID=A0A075K3F5_9GAMM|nr:hypothetical protein HY57_13720 [Dyella japonica A8]
MALGALALDPNPPKIDDKTPTRKIVLIADGCTRWTANQQKPMAIGIALGLLDDGDMSAAAVGAEKIVSQGGATVTADTQRFVVDEALMNTAAVLQPITFLGIVARNANQQLGGGHL